MRLFVVGLIAFWMATAAESPFLGTWKLNEAKSKPGPAPAGTPALPATFHFTMEGNVLVGTPKAADGRSLNAVRYDGQEHAAGTSGGNPIGYTHAVSTVRGTELITEYKKEGKVLASRRRVLSKDGRTLTIYMNGVMPSGEKVQSTLVYDKQ